MKTFKIHLLAATIVAGGTIPAVASAQFVYPAAELRGVGASSIQNALVQSLNCIGNPGDHSAGNTDNQNRLGTNTGALNPVAEGSFVQTSPSGPSPDFNCDREEIQPNFQGKYVATGSGTGRAFWRLFQNQLPGTTSSNINPFGTWNNVQFAFSDAPASASDLAAYDTNANSQANKAGAPIQFPLYVLPVALAYNPVYARYRSPDRGLISLTFNLKPTFVTTDANGNPTGGIKMSKVNYCSIFNGTITNWNDSALKNNGVAGSLMDPNDDTARWRNDGVPIRLVGRLDNSGTTDVFTRHLAQVCDGISGVTNKFDVNAEALPFDRSSGINLSAFRSDTRYTPSSTGALAGTIQSLSGAVFIRASGSTPASINTTQGNEALGLFLVADGSSGVRDGINFQEEPANGNGQIALNGKFGYIGSDFVKPAPGSTLFSAALQVGGAGSKYVGPTSENAVAAFGNTTYLPPQTTSANGAYNPADTRTGPSRSGQGGDVPIDRDNPLHWTSVLYNSNGQTLAAPRLGYPITGTTQFLGYTCYADPANRLAMDLFLSAYTGNLKRDSANNPVSVNLIVGTRPSALGLLAQLGLAPMPAAWLTAINETFLKNSNQGSGALGAKNLWIQNGLPARSVNSATSNPTCVDGKGA